MENNNEFDELTCPQIFALLSEYLDAELPADLCERLSGHIEDCPPCVEFLTSLRRTIALCRAFKAGETSAPLAAEAREKLRLAYEEMMNHESVR